MEKLEADEQWLQGICNNFVVPSLFCRIRNVPVTVEGVPVILTESKKLSGRTPEYTASSMRVNCC